jgi:hypothetical protein
MKLLLKELNLTCLQYDAKSDPTRKALQSFDLWKEEFTRIEWTIGPRAVSSTRKRLIGPEVKQEPKSKKANNAIQSKSEKNNPNSLAPGRFQDVISTECKQLNDQDISVKTEPDIGNLDSINGLLVDIAKPEPCSSNIAENSTFTAVN